MGKKYWVWIPSRYEMGRHEKVGVAQEFGGSYVHSWRDREGYFRRYGMDGSSEEFVTEAAAQAALDAAAQKNHWVEVKEVDNGNCSIASHGAHS